jgi:uncharacterized protein with HEPN domain
VSKDQRLYVMDLLERVLRLKQIAAAGEMTFRSSFMHQDSAIRNFEVIGEIVKRLDAGLLAQQPQLNWRGYAGFRDVLIHQYDKVLVDIVWQSMQQDLPQLQAAVEGLLAVLPPEENDGEAGT